MEDNRYWLQRCEDIYADSLSELCDKLNDFYSLQHSKGNLVVASQDFSDENRESKDPNNFAVLVIYKVKPVGEEIMDSTNKEDWRNETANPAQIKFLKLRKIEIEKRLKKGVASKMIDEIKKMEDKNAEPN